MTTILTLILLLIGQVLFAQNKTATPFDKFVKKSTIEWAAYASDTINFSQAGLNTLLLSRLERKVINASLPVESRTEAANQVRYSILDTIDHAFYGDDTELLIGSPDNEPKQNKIIPIKNNSNFKITELTQILYVEKGKLKSYIPFISPTLPVFMSSGNYIGERFYFSTCFNYTYNQKPRKKSKLIFLLQTKKMMPLHPPQQTDQLKTMYGKNLLETLWPYRFANKIDAYTIDGNRKLAPGELNANTSNDQPSIVPIYDSVGHIIRYQVVARQAEPNEFTDAQIWQDWYYDTKKNKVFSFITTMVLYVNTSNQKENIEPEAILKLVFK